REHVAPVAGAIEDRKPDLTLSGLRAGEHTCELFALRDADVAPEHDPEVGAARAHLGGARLRRAPLHVDPVQEVADGLGWGRGAPRCSFTASSRSCAYSSNPTAATCPCCSAPRMFPAPRISRSLIAILNPAPSSLASKTAWSRFRACSVRC